jgi:hypothetical protein
LQTSRTSRAGDLSLLGPLPSSRRRESSYLSLPLTPWAENQFFILFYFAAPVSEHPCPGTKVDLKK